MVDRNYIGTLPVIASLFPFLVLGSFALRDKAEMDMVGERQEENYISGKALNCSGRRYMSGRGHRG